MKFTLKLSLISILHPSALRLPPSSFLLQVLIQKPDGPFPRQLCVVRFVERPRVGEESVIGSLIPKHFSRNFPAFQSLFELCGLAFRKTVISGALVDQDWAAQS